MRLAARIIKTNARTPLSLKLQRTSCVWAVNLPTTKTFEFFFFVSMSCDALFLGSVQDILSGGLPIWRDLRLEGCFLCVCDFLSFLSPWMDQLSFRYQMVYIIYGDHNPYSILHIPYSMLYVIYDLEGSNDSDVNLQSTEFDPCR